MKPERGLRRSRDRRRLRVSGAAGLLGVSRSTVRRWADAGVLPCRRSPDGERLFLVADLERFLGARDAGGGRPSSSRAASRGRGRAAGSGGGDEVARAPARAGALDDVRRAVARAAEPRDALEQLAGVVRRELGLRRCLICTRDDRLDRPVCVAGGGRRTVEPAALEGLCTSVTSVEPFRRAEDIVVPFGVGGSVNGCLVLREAGDRLTAADLDFVGAAGDLAALAVDRLRTVGRRRDQQARVDSLLHAGRSITSSLVLQEVLDAVAHEVVDALGCDYCVMWEYDETEDALVQCAGYSADPAFSVEQGYSIRLSERPRERRILTSHEPVLETISDPELDAQSRASMEEWGEKTCLSLPLRFGASPLGVLVVCETERERRFSPQELDLARGLANQASAAVNNARAYRDLARQNAELEARARRERIVSELGVELSSSLDPRIVLDFACRRISELLDATGCEMWARSEEGQVECLAAWVDGQSLEEWVGRRYPVDHWAATSLAMDGGQTVAIASLEDARLGEEERLIMEEWDQQSLLILPMQARGRAVGTVEVTQAGRARVFSDEEIATAEACARMTALAVDNAMLFEEQADHARRLTSLLEAGRAVTSSLDLDEVLQALVRTAASSLGFPEALIYEHDPEADTVTLRCLFEQDPRAYEEVDQTYPLCDYPSDRAVLAGSDVLVETISDPSLPADVRESMELNGEKTCLTAPLRYGDKPLGMLVLADTEQERAFSDGDLEFARGFAEQAAVALHNANLFEDMKGMHLGNLRALSSALTAKDYYTIGHAARVAAYAVLLAEELGWSPRAVQQLEEATYLHDIGKIAMADRVLLKSGPLTDEEWELMRQHPVISAEIIEALLDDECVAGVRHHHEHWDGTGYPDGLSGEQIPLVARLLCLVDSYDAMSSRRVYRPALDRAECRAELLRCAGTQFDAGLVEAFLVVLDRMQQQRCGLQRAVDEAAASLDAGDHMVVCRTRDATGEEYARVRGLLRRTRLAHPLAQTMSTIAQVDELRCMVVVDDDDDEGRAVAPGEIEFCDDLELETLTGRPKESNVVNVDRWGTWIAAAAPIRADDGSIVGIVEASRMPRGGAPLFGRGSTVRDTFSQIMNTAGARKTRVEIESMTDALTGLYNHRRFHELLRDSVESARPGDDAVALLFCDIDCFKRLNDRHGHLAGDDVLRRVSRILGSCVRSGDIAARYGGDEFCVLLRGTGMDAAVEVAERIRTQVAELWVGQDRAVTVSVGVAVLSGHRDAEQLLEQADRAMYAAKQGGRDRVVRADTLEAARARLTTQL